MFVKEINAYGAVILQYPVIVRVLLFSKNTHKSQAKQYVKGFGYLLYDAKTQCQQINNNLTQFEDNNCRQLPFKILLAEVL